MSEEKPDNVVALFPNSPSVDLEKVRALNIKSNELRQIEAGEISRKLVHLFMENLYLAGFNVSDETKCKELALVLESISSYVHKYSGIFHPIQPISDAIFDIRPDKFVHINVEKIEKLMSDNKENDDS